MQCFLCRRNRSVYIYIYIYIHTHTHTHTHIHTDKGMHQKVKKDYQRSDAPHMQHSSAAL